MQRTSARWIRHPALLTWAALVLAFGLAVACSDVTNPPYIPNPDDTAGQDSSDLQGFLVVPTANGSVLV